MKRPRRGHRWDKSPFVPAKVKRYLRFLRRQALGEVYDDRYPDTTKAETLPMLYKARSRRRAKNKVAKQSRKVNR
jgi:hypothetical protein